jgi:hypothetical protein
MIALIGGLPFPYTTIPLAGSGRQVLKGLSFIPDQSSCISWWQLEKLGGFGFQCSRELADDL